MVCLVDVTKNCEQALIMLSLISKITVQLISKLTLQCTNMHVFLCFCRVTQTELAYDTRVIFRVEHTSSILCAAQDPSSCAARLQEARE